MCVKASVSLCSCVCVDSIDRRVLDGSYVMDGVKKKKKEEEEE